MGTMQRFGTYFAIIILLFIITYITENFALSGRYVNISCTFDDSFNENKDNFEIENLEAKSGKYRGFINFDIINTSTSDINKCYLKIDLYNDQDLLAKTQYIEINDFRAGETRNIKLKYEANNINRFAVSVVEETPDKTNILNLFGWEIDLTNVFGHDLTNTKIFGKPILEIFSINGNGFNGFNFSGAKEKGYSLFNGLFGRLQQVPWWAYGIGWCIIVGLI